MNLFLNMRYYLIMTKAFAYLLTCLLIGCLEETKEALQETQANEVTKPIPEVGGQKTPGCENRYSGPHSQQGGVNVFPVEKVVDNNSAPSAQHNDDYHILDGTARMLKNCGYTFPNVVNSAPSARHDHDFFTFVKKYCGVHLFSFLESDNPTSSAPKEQNIPLDDDFSTHQMKQISLDDCRQIIENIRSHTNSRPFKVIIRSYSEMISAISNYDSDYWNRTRASDTQLSAQQLNNYIINYSCCKDMRILSILKLKIKHIYKHFNQHNISQKLSILEHLFSQVDNDHRYLKCKYKIVSGHLTSSDGKEKEIETKESFETVINNEKHVFLAVKNIHDHIFLKHSMLMKALHDSETPSSDWEDVK